MTDEEQAAAMDALEERLAARIVAKLAEMAGGFPSAEDIALIRDHVNPNGVAFQNGRRAAMRELRAVWDKDGAFGVLDLLKKEQG